MSERQRWSSFSARQIAGATVLALFLALAIASAFAPRPIHKPVKPSTIKASACGSFGRVTRAVEVDDAGPAPIYAVRCADGVTLKVAQ